MAIDQLVASLLRVELFQGLKPLQITEISRLAERIVFRPGDKIIMAGQPGDAAYLIVSGAAEWLPSTDTGSQIGEPIEIGSLIGEMAMLIDHVYGATIIANGQVRCLKLTREAMHAQMLADPALAQHLTSKITQRLTRVAQELKAIDQDFGEPFSDYAHEGIASADAQPQLAH